MDMTHDVSDARTLADYIVEDMKPWGLPEEVLKAASQVMAAPADRIALSVVVGYLEREIEDADSWGPPEEVWDALEGIQCVLKGGK